MSVVLLRALVIHTQWLYILSTMVDVPWPATLAVRCRLLGVCGRACLAQVLGLTAFCRIGRACL
jgi:hypothetical protein